MNPGKQTAVISRKRAEVERTEASWGYPVWAEVTREETALSKHFKA